MKGNNMHRVVVYRDGGDKGGQMVPYITMEPWGSINPRDLWNWLAEYEEKTGGDVLAIAHNGNPANGIMFPLKAQYDDRRQRGANGKLPPVGNTVNAASASWTNTVGASELGTVWTDPDFDPAQRAVYCARVIEIPTPRWSTYDAMRFGVELPEGAPVSTQERAYTSPIWYTP